MKFCDKLLNLRKQNNMSQEQLADKLGVSRQAVSKWESASSVPDMEKMMQLCKILNCSLDELVDDGIGGNKKINLETKHTWNDYYKEVLDFITRSLNMFWSMRLIEKIKCLLEMTFLALIFWLILTIAGNFIHSSFYPILTILPNNVYQVIYSISSFVYQIFGLIASFVLLVHIFKIRYLDYFITIEDKEIKEKTIETPIEELEQQPKKEEPRKFIEKKKNKIIIRDPKHSTYGFFNVLAKIVIWFLKFLLICFAIPCIICFVGISFLEICSLWYIKDGIFFIGTTFAIFGCLIVNYLVLKMIYYFIFELNYPFQKIFILFIIGLLLAGSGAGISFCSYLTFEEISMDKEMQEETKKEISYEENLVLPFIEEDNTKIIEDNNLNNIEVEIKHIKEIKVELYSNTSIIVEGTTNRNFYTTYHVEILSNKSDIDEMNYLLELIKDKKRLTYQEEYPYQITVRASKDTLEKLKNNYQSFYHNDFE